jgi:hypothetical protein
MHELRLVIELSIDILQIGSVRRCRTTGIDVGLKLSLKTTRLGLPEINFLMDFIASAWPALQIALSPSIIYLIPKH